NSACIDNEARYKQARQYGFSEKMSFLPGTTYIASESSFYRILKEADQLHRRGRAQAPRRVSKPETYKATGTQGESIDTAVDE
ncbi:MAG: hypothetical protein KZQ66_04665, partial [Candidatus Thiodiazotropha sp. (ex Lucinoma aequizonata)]|nr:hypothetical protein [Candidatus Thiodiazotropha sp. (ex Lucinoma aequizonata)]